MKNFCHLFNRLCLSLCVVAHFHAVAQQSWEPVVDEDVQERLLKAQQVSADDPQLGISLLETVEAGERSAADWFQFNWSNAWSLNHMKSPVMH